MRKSKFVEFLFLFSRKLISVFIIRSKRDSVNFCISYQSLILLIRAEPWLSVRFTRLSFKISNKPSPPLNKYITRTLIGHSAMRTDTAEARIPGGNFLVGSYVHYCSLLHVHFV